MRDHSHLTVYMSCNDELVVAYRLRISGTNVAAV